MEKTTSKADSTPRFPIALLSADIVERIAAGEVIERPASVVRELIENALDAGASTIRIELREGGIRLIRVGDDGLGIPADELTLAASPHATSKVRQPADLDRVTTLGFRGEALASVAAIAQLRLVSSTDDRGVAAVLTLAPATAPARGFEPRPRGTTVTVRDLFHSVPARHAMLHGPRGEERLALSVIRGYALSHPMVRFTVVADGVVVLQTPGNGIEGVVGTIYGTDVARALQSFGPEPLEGGTFRGWVAPRAFTQTDRAHVLLCINGRPVRNRSLLTAVESGYRPLLRKGRHPILIAKLDLDPAMIDVNIHPAKAEVLVQAERTYTTAIREAIHTTLGRAPAQPTPTFPQRIGLYRSARQYPLPLGRHRRGTRLAEPRPLYPATDYGAAHPAEWSIPPLEPLGQLDLALIVATTADGQLYLVDQHRAHERLLYEELNREAPSPPSLDVPGDSASDCSPDQHGQLLLEPLVVELLPRQAEVLASRLDELATLGLACEPFGGTTFLVRSLPTVSGAAAGPAGFAGALAADAAEDAPDWRDHFRISLACRAALRRGQPLSLAEQRTLLADLRTATVSAICPHGSPIFVRYSQAFFTRLFEW